VSDYRALTASLAAALLLAASGAAFRARAQNAPSGEQPTFRTGVVNVVVPVTVTQRDGTIVSGLTPQNFRLLDNGRAQKITEDIAIHPLSMVIAIQATADVEKILPQIQKIGSALHAQVIGDDGEVAILAYDHRIQKLTDDFTSDPDKITAALKKLRPGSDSWRLNDAAIEGVNLLRTRPPMRRRALLLIGESRDKGSELKAREVLNQAEFANVVIYSIDMSRLMAALTAEPSAGRSVLDTRPPGAVQLPAGNVETPTTQRQMAVGNWVPLFNEIFLGAKALFVSNPLEVYTTYTGGREYSFKTQRELDRAVSELGEELHSQYLLTYTPDTATQGEAGYHNIVVQVLKPDLKVRARDGYYWAGKPSSGQQP
jgi:VWFA-related protein